MPTSRGVFKPEVIARNHQHLKVAEPEKLPLPDQVEYHIPSELVRKLRNNRGRIKHSVGKATTLARPAVARMLYMDVGRWGGSADSHKSTATHWGRRRDFGIVWGRLVALCSYEIGWKEG